MFVFVFALFLFFWRWHMFFRWHWNEINRNHGRKRKRARTVDQWLHSLEHCRAACTSAALRELHYGVRCVASCTTAVFVAQHLSAYAPTEATSSSARNNMKSSLKARVCHLIFIVWTSPLVRIKLATVRWRLFDVFNKGCAYAFQGDRFSRRDAYVCSYFFVMRRTHEEKVRDPLQLAKQQRCFRFMACETV